MKTVVQRAEDRGGASHGWLQARFSFSFAGYYNLERMGFGKLRVLNNDIIQPAQGFGTHSHENMEIITIPLKGALEHKDSLGSGGVVRPGEIQVMSAGTGIFHSEFNSSSEEELELFQIWIEPDTQNVTPRYDQAKVAGGKGRLKQVVGPKGKGGLEINADAKILIGEFESGEEISYDIGCGRGIFVMVIEGEIEVAGEELMKRDSIEISEAEVIKMKIGRQSRVLVIDVKL